MARKKKSVSSSGSSSSSNDNISNNSSSSESSESSPERQNNKRKPHDLKKSFKVPDKPTKDKIEVERKRKSHHSHSPKKDDGRSKARKGSENEKSPSDKRSSSKPEVKDNKRRREDKKHALDKDKVLLDKEIKAKNLFPIMGKEGSPIIEEKKKITETQLVSYPSLSSSVTNMNRNKRSRADPVKHKTTSPEQFRSLSSTITVKQGFTSESKSEPESPIQTSPRDRDKAPGRSLRDRVGWDPFKGNTAPQYGDHDDRQMNQGYNDSYTRKEFRQFRGGGRGAMRGSMGWRGGPRDWSRDGSRGGPRDELRGGSRDGTRGGSRGGLWSNNRSFDRDGDTVMDRSGINDNKWKRDLFTDD